MSHKLTGSFFCLQFFSIVVLGCIANEGYVNRPGEEEEYCIFNRNQNACSFSIAMGTLCFLCCTGFLALDIYFPHISSMNNRKKAVMADIGVSGERQPPVSATLCFSASLHDL